MMHIFELATYQIQIVAESLTIFSLCAVFKPHQTAGPVLSCSDHIIAYSHVHGGACVSIMTVKETGTVLVFSDQL